MFNFSPIEVEDVADKQVIFLGKGRKNRKRRRNKMWIFMEKRKKNIKRGKIVRLNIFVIFLSKCDLFVLFELLELLGLLGLFG